jgi:hypothetical protein
LSDRSIKRKHTGKFQNNVINDQGDIPSKKIRRKNFEESDDSELDERNEHDLQIVNNSKTSNQKKKTVRIKELAIEYGSEAD